MTNHICEVCFQPSHEHKDPEYHCPRCCYGCPCGSTMPAPMTRPSGVSDPQWAMLQEIEESGILYIKDNHPHYGRTIKALAHKGLVRIAEHDHSPYQMDGWSVCTKETS
jgi:hypothetical protein